MPIGNAFGSTVRPNAVARPSESAMPPASKSTYEEGILPLLALEADDVVMKEQFHELAMARQRAEFRPFYPV